MTLSTSPRTVPAGAAAALGGLIFVVLGLVPGIGPDVSGLDTWMLAATVALLLVVAGVAGLARSGLAGPGWFARIGLGLALLGLAAFALAHAAAGFSPESDGNPLFPVGGMLGGLGMLVTGIAVLRARRWTGAGRLSPLACGLYPFVVLIPAFALFGDPNFPAIAGFGAVWAWFGIALARAE